MANGDDDAKSPLARLAANIFTEKVVGLAFAIAFGSWSLNLYVLKDAVISAATELHEQTTKLDARITALDSSFQAYKTDDLLRLSTVVERQNSVMAQQKLLVELTTRLDKQIAVMERR